MTISHIKAALTEALSDPTPVGSPIGEPVAHIRYKEWERDDAAETGIWECSPGRWNRAVADQEFCHFIAGAGTFTPTGGDPIPFKAGDAFMLSANTFGVWDITETVRKTYVLIKR